MNQKNCSQQGQVVVILLLVIVVVLAIGLSWAGRTTTEISTSNKSENSSRAFSAAEAGIEQALNNPASAGTSNIDFSSDNTAQAEVKWSKTLPQARKALEFPPIGKETFAQVWFASPDDLSAYYLPDSFDIYFGRYEEGGYVDEYSIQSKRPAVEVNLIIQQNGTLSNPKYYSKKVFVDSYKNAGSADDRPQTSGFLACGSKNVTVETNTSGNNRKFYCQTIISGVKNNANDILILARVRLLYAQTAQGHPVAIAPVASASLPPQVTIYRSTGKSGNSIRNLELFQMKYVVPHLFDFVLFSAGDIEKF